jgi:uncharacterized protein YbjQ (UPF0145 family)
MLLPEHHKMVASTLHAPPVGFKVLAQKPIVVANISYQIQGPTKEQASSQQVASLMQAAQNELLRQAHAAACNAVLGIGFSVTTTSSGLPGQSATTLAMVSAFGTPCTVAKDPNFSLPGMLPPGMPPDPNAPAQTGMQVGVSGEGTVPPSMPPDPHSVTQSGMHVAATSEGVEVAAVRTDSASSLDNSEVTQTAELCRTEENSEKVAKAESRQDDDDDEFAEAESVMGAEVETCDGNESSPH